MKTLVTYYSFSGNTDKVAQIFADVLKEKGEVELQRLKPKDEIRSFLGQCKAARTKMRQELEGAVKYDVSDYDLVIIGSPVWAFAPVPAVNTYLDKLNGLHGKKVVLLLTSGSGLGVKQCFKNIREVLQAKGASSIIEINIPDRKQQDKSFISASVKNAVQNG